MKTFQVKALALLLFLAIILAAVSCEQTEVLPNPENIDHIEQRAVCPTPSPSSITSDEYNTVIHVYMHPYTSNHKQIMYRLKDGGFWVPAITVRAGIWYYTINKNSACSQYEVRVRQKCNGVWSNWSTATSVGGSPFTCY